MIRGFALAALMVAACGDGNASGADASGQVADARPVDALVPRPLPDGGALRECEARVAGPEAPLALTDLAATESRLTLAAAGDGRVHGLSITVDLAHPYPRDLELALVSPAGTTAVLARQEGGYERVTFVEERFDGEPMAGAWTLRVTDGARGDTGILYGWAIEASGCATPACAISTRSSERSGEPVTYHTLEVGPEIRAAGARVGVDVEYEFDEDLSISLSAPGGPTVSLSSGNGGLGSDYVGTIFDDTAPLSITEGLPPFTGRFRPEEPLARVAGRPATGTWAIVMSGPGQGLFVLRAALEVDLCDLPCPEGSTPSSAAVGEVTATGTVAAAGVRIAGAASGPLLLRAPSGKRVSLAGAGAFEDVLFVDWAARSATEGDPPWSGARRPAEALASLAGESAAGGWSVEGAAGAEVTLHLCVR